jgi:hypothetical protein
VALLAALLVVALLPASAQAPRSTTTVQPITVGATAIESFDAGDPTRIRFGKLVFRGGLVLDSTHRSFGGFSSLRVLADGERFLAVTDKGHWLRGRIVSRGGRPIAIADAEMAPILGPDGRPVSRRGWYDTEALAEEGGVVHVGIERVNQILRFDYGKDGLRARGQPIALPPAIKALPHNQGLECLVAAPASGALAGTLIAISERGLDARGNLQGFLLGRVAGAFSLVRSDDFDVSDCAVTPRGELLVLERRFSWLSGLAMRIRSLRLADVKPGATLDGPVLINADLGQQVDNMEGLAVHRAPDGALVLTLISDDNFSPLQRTLLLQFTLGE